MFRILGWAQEFAQRSTSPQSLFGLSIDLGSARTKVIFQGQVVFHQPTCIALHRKTGEVIAIGQAAAELVGKTPPHIEVVFPIRYGKVDQIVAAQLFLQLCLRNVLRGTTSHLSFKQMFHPSVKLAVPMTISSAEREMLRKLFREIGFSRISFVTQLEAAYHHLQIQKKVSRVFALVNIGAMTTEMAFFAENEIIVKRSLALGGDDFTRVALQEMQKEYHCQVGWQTAEKVKISLGIYLDEGSTLKGRKMVVRGRDILSSLPTTVQVSAEILAVVYQPLIHDLIQNIADLFQDAAPEIMAEGLDQGVMLTGGGSLLLGLSAAFEAGLRSPIHTSRTALEDVVKGI